MRPASCFSIIQLSNSRIEKIRYIPAADKTFLRLISSLNINFTFLILSDIIPSLTVSKRKNRCIPYIYWSAAIFVVVMEYSNLFSSFTLFLNCFHFAFCYKLIISSKTTGFMESVSDRLPFIQRYKSLFLNFSKIHCFQRIY